jgi:pilus assembly protein CpaB
MKPARILLLVVAIVAGGLAAFLATRGGTPAATQTVEVTQIQQEARSRVLIANRSIGLGQRITADDVSWQDWPQGAVRPEYITSEQVPDAPTQLAGAVARFEIFNGEPIREAKLVRAEQGYLSAVITQGMRAVSIGVTAESASGGFIVPNDRVDVVLTRSGSGSNGVSETILTNVRVLAIGKRLGEMGQTSGGAEDPSSQVFENAQIATLELSPSQSESVLNAGSAGRLALVLRSVVDFAESPTAERGRTQAIRLIRYGQDTSVMSGVPSAPTALAQASGQVPQISAEPMSPLDAAQPAGTPPAPVVEPEVELR